MTAQTTTNLANLFIEDPSAIVSAILNIKKEVEEPEDWLDQRKWAASPLQNYLIGLNEIGNIIYIEVTIHRDALDKGFPPREYEANLVKTRAGVRDDCPGQIIGQKIGGDGIQRNVFPLNSKIDLSQWRADEDSVYQHVSKRENCTAELKYGLEYDEEKKVSRPIVIWYSFNLLLNGKSTGKILEGKVENLYPENWWL